MGTHSQIKAQFCKEVYICNIPALWRPKKEDSGGFETSWAAQIPDQPQLQYETLSPEKKVSRQNIHSKACSVKSQGKTDVDDEMTSKIIGLVKIILLSQKNKYGEKEEEEKQKRQIDAQKQTERCIQRHRE